MTWTRLTVHWIVSDSDLGEVSVYTPSKGLCRGTCCMDYIQVLEDMLRACVLDHKGRRAIALSGIRLQTIVIRRVYGWHRIRHCMGGYVGHR